MKETYQAIMNKNRKIFIVLAIFLLIFIIYWNSKLLPISTMQYWVDVNNLPIARFYQTHHPSKNKTILYWNSFFGVKDMYFGSGSLIFRNCSVNSCFATSNRTILPIEEYDAVIFHGPRYSAASDNFPEKRSIHQKYIFYSLESPFNSDFDNVAKRHFYNWTMTYRRDSDIHRPYAIVQKVLRNYVLPSVEEVKNKTKKVAWFVSNCRSKGSERRMKYAKELQKYIPVDIYGKCGTMQCHSYDKCYQMLERDYKFYLSFENSMCKDYVTEKMFNILKYNVVPIVLGVFNNSVIAPPHSVVSTENFKSAKELAKYLWHLDRNVNDYSKYFEWKKSYTIQDSTKTTLCQLCEMLNKPVTYSSYDNIEDWFYGFNCFV